MPPPENAFTENVVRESDLDLSTHDLKNVIVISVMCTW